MNERMKAFAETYLRGLTGEKISAPDAYLKVYKTRNKKVAYKESHRLLNREDVKEYLRQRMSEMVMSSNEVLLRLSDIAQRGTNFEKLKALELIGKTLGLFTDRMDITTGGDKISFKEFINSNYGNIKLPKEI